MRFHPFREYLALVAVALAACGDDSPAEGQGGGGGGSSASASVGDSSATGVPIPATGSTSAPSASAGSGGDGAGGAGGDGVGGDGGEGGAGAGAMCAPAESLPGAGGCSGGDETIDDCATAENEGCTARAVCGPGILGPRVAGDVMYAQRGAGEETEIGRVSDDLAFTTLFHEGIAGLIGTDPTGFAYLITNGDTPGSVDLVRLADDGSFGYRRPVLNPPPLEARGDADGNAVLFNPGFVQQLSFDEPLEGEGAIALHSVTREGVQRWSRRYGGADSDLEIRDYEVEPGGDIAIVGRYGGEVDFGPDPLPMGEHGFVARLDGASGDVEWVAISSTINGVVFAEDGSIIAVGSAFDDVTFDTKGVVSRFDVDGGIVWTRELVGDELTASLYDVALVGDALIVVGALSGSASIGDVAVESYGPLDEPLLLRVDLDGTPAWARTLDVHLVEPNEILVDAPAMAYGVTPLCGRAYVVGSFGGPSIAELDGVTVTNPDDARRVFGIEIGIEP